MFNNSKECDGGARFSMGASFSLNSLVVNCWSLFIVPFINFAISWDAFSIALSTFLSFFNIGKPTAASASVKDCWNDSIVLVNVDITVCIFFVSDWVSGLGQPSECFSVNVSYFFLSAIVFMLFASDASTVTFDFDGELNALFPACLGARSPSLRCFCGSGSSSWFLE